MTTRRPATSSDDRSFDVSRLFPAIRNSLSIAGNIVIILILFAWIVTASSMFDGTALRLWLSKVGLAFDSVGQTMIYVTAVIALQFPKLEPFASRAIRRLTGTPSEPKDEEPIVRTPPEPDDTPQSDAPAPESQVEEPPSEIGSERVVYLSQLTARPEHRTIDHVSASEANIFLAGTILITVVGLIVTVNHFRWTIALSNPVTTDAVVLATEVVTPTPTPTGILPTASPVQSGSMVKIENAEQKPMPQATPTYYVTYVFSTTLEDGETIQIESHESVSAETYRVATDTRRLPIEFAPQNPNWHQIRGESHLSPWLTALIALVVIGMSFLQYSLTRERYDTYRRLVNGDGRLTGRIVTGWVSGENHYVAIAVDIPGTDITMIKQSVHKSVFSTHGVNEKILVMYLRDKPIICRAFFKYEAKIGDVATTG